ncbi:SitI3 family protein [Paenibacillus sp. KS-LC4]|uniref:SitI3 family protein n=1 Tax=Paenibacillus sp. KS-LC4 TaxID=2979727 RepID=UPI0030D20CBB
MALQYSLMFEERLLTQSMVTKVLKQLGFVAEQLVPLTNGFRIDEFNERIGFSVTIVNTLDMSFGWDSDYLEEEFVYQQHVSFKLYNSYDTEPEACELMLKMVFSLLETVGSDALLTFSDSEIFYRKNNALYVNNDFGFWEHDSVKALIGAMEYQPFRAMAHI